MTRFVILDVPIGSVVLAAGDHSPSHVLLTRRRAAAAMRWARRRLPGARHEPRLLPPLQRRLRAYFRGHSAPFRTEPDLTGLTPFQRAVLRACQAIPFGQTVSYAELARRVGRPRAARAVGAALARNPVPIIIPCHRVIAADGRLGGFSAEQGVKLKKWLLDLESRPGRQRGPK